MENLIYAVECDLFLKNKIVEILKYNSLYFFPISHKRNESNGEYSCFSEDKIWFIKKAIVLNYTDFKIVIGNTFRDDLDECAFQIYCPNEIKKKGFNYNPEFSKMLVTMNDCDLNSASPILSINLKSKNLVKNINGEDITSSNVRTRNSRYFKSVNLEEAKKSGIEKLFVYNYEDFLIVIGWVLQGRKRRHTVIYNSEFTNFLMDIEGEDLKIPNGFKNENKKGNKKNIPENPNEYREIGDYGLKYTPNPKINMLKNPFKFNFKSGTNGKQPIPYFFKDRSHLWTDKTPFVVEINALLEKISRLGIESLTNEELEFLKNNSI